MGFLGVEWEIKNNSWGIPQLVPKGFSPDKTALGNVASSAAVSVSNVLPSPSKIGESIGAIIASPIKGAVNELWKPALIMLGIAAGGVALYYVVSNSNAKVLKSASGVIKKVSL